MAAAARLRVQMAYTESRTGDPSLRTPEDVDLTVHEDLAAIGAEWRAFQQVADGTVFQTHEWLSVWQRVIGCREDTRPAIVIGRDRAGATLFLLPLATRRARFCRELVWLGSDLCDYNGPLLAPGFSAVLDAAGFARLWTRIDREIRKSPRLVHDFARLEKMSAMVGAQPNPMLFLPTSPHPSGAYLTRLAPSWDEFYGTKRSSDTRQRDRSKRKRLNALGEVRLDEPEGQVAVLRALETLMRQKSGSFARMGVSNLFEKPGYAEFYTALATAPETTRLVHVSQLKVGDEAAAVNVGLTFRGRYYHLLASHTDNQRMARFGPGATHMHEILRRAIDSGHEYFDFTIGDEKYKTDWCDDRQVLRDHVRASSLRGAIGAWLVKAHARIKRLIKQTPFLWEAFRKARAAAARFRPRNNAGSAPPLPVEPLTQSEVESSS